LKSADIERPVGLNGRRPLQPRSGAAATGVR